MAQLVSIISYPVRTSKVYEPICEKSHLETPTYNWGVKRNIQVELKIKTNPNWMKPDGTDLANGIGFGHHSKRLKIIYIQRHTFLVLLISFEKTRSRYVSS